MNNLVSSEGDGSQSSPFKTIYNSLNTNVNNDNLNIIITTNQTPYIINKCGNLTYNLSIFCVNGLAVLDFSENGMFYIENNYSLGFQNIIIQQSSSNFYQDQIIYFFNGLNISFQVKKYFSFDIDFFTFFIELSFNKYINQCHIFICHQFNIYILLQN